MAHATLRITTEQRRARLGRRHFLAPGHAASDPVELTRGLVALHATDPSTVHVSAAVRMGMQPVSVMDDALYEQRTLIRMLGMRRTLFIVPDDFAGIVQTSSTDAVAATHRKRLLKMLADAGAGGDDWLRKVEEATHDALLEMGHATGQQLSAAVPLLQTKLHLNVGKKYESIGNITTQVLTLMAAEGHIVRGRPKGTWISSQYDWWPVEAWLPGGIPRPPAEEAREELVRAWLARFGPATIADIKWWTGWTLGQTRAAVAALDTVPVEFDDGSTGIVLAVDTEDEPAPEPWVALLPGLDPTVMGWTERDWYLRPEDRSSLFDTAGNAGPTIWCDGRIVGGWTQRADGEVVTRLLDKVDRSARKAIDVAADTMHEWMAGVRVAGRFPSPIEKEILG